MLFVIIVIPEGLSHSLCFVKIIWLKWLINNTVASNYIWVFVSLENTF